MTTPSLPSLPDRFCSCGCGRPTLVSKRTGLLNSYVNGHRANLQKIDFSSAAPFKLRGVYCKLIQLTRGFFVIVNADDHPELAKNLWFALTPKGKGTYAARSFCTASGRNRVIMMHREILGLKEDDPTNGDHVDSWNTLDNSRLNLRRASDAQNCYNAKRRKDNTSGYKGVGWHKVAKQYSARIRVNGRGMFLGYRRTAEAAWRELYVPAAEKFHGQFARTV